ncbi:DUF559 domain-containing protein [Hymenobacter montanus]|uniref:DUF559 domain-containing protein n=1 Tax=Hymenobacter montanus TaxID=2771359 RepID=UPI0037422B1C
MELSGETHLTREQGEYDAGRTFTLTELGYAELRFTNQQALYHLNEVLAIITDKLRNSPSIFPQQQRVARLPLSRGLCA